MLRHLVAFYAALRDAGARVAVRVRHLPKDGDED